MYNWNLNDLDVRNENFYYFKMALSMMNDSLRKSAWSSRSDGELDKEKQAKPWLASVHARKNDGTMFKEHWRQICSENMLNSLTP